MRKTCLTLALAVLAGCSTPPVVKDAAPPSSPPVLEQITYHTVQERYLVVYPEFHFHSADGTVDAIHREIVSTDSPTPLRFVSDDRIIISAEQQKKGAIYVGGWHCGPEHYQVQLRAYLIDSNKNHSNTVDYSINCAG